MENNKSETTIWNFLIKNRALATLVTIAICLFGTMSAINLPRELQPEINIGMATVVTILPGANPTDTESLITKKLEAEIATVPNIKSLTSTSGLGTSFIIIEFEAEADLNESVQKVKEAVDRKKGDLPEDATDPLVSKAETNSQAIITFSLVSKKPLYEMTNVAEDIQTRLEKISGVSKVDILGGQYEKIEVIVNKEKLENYGLGIENIANTIKFSDFNLPVGIIKADEMNYSIRIDGRINAIEEIRNTPIIRTNGEEGTTIFIKDVAIVKKSYTKQDIISKLSINGEKSGQTISLLVKKKNLNNSIKIADDSKAVIEEMQKNNEIPADMQVAIANDNSELIRKDLGTLTSNGYQTTFLIVILLFLALGLKEGIIAGLSIPLSFLATFVVMDIYGLSLNGLTLFSLVIALGLMVDTAIVIMEGTHENLKNGMNSTDAAIRAVEEYKWPLLAGTLTTIFAFFPMLLVSGLVGQFLKSLPITISATLISSLIISLTIIPSFSARVLKKSEKGSVLEPIFNKIGGWFHDVIYGIITRKSRRVLVLLLSLVLFFASMALPITGALKAELFPQTDQSFFIINIETPKGTILSKTKSITEGVEQKLYGNENIENFVTLIGTSQSLASTELVETSGGNADSNIANITVNLKPAAERLERSYEIAEEIRKDLEKTREAKVTVNEFKEGPPSDAAITVRITGDNLDTIKIISNDIKKVVEATPGTQNVRDTLTQGLNEFKFTFDRDKLNFHGISGIQAASALRNSVQGIKATTLNLNEKDVDVMVKYDWTEKEDKEIFTLNELENIELQSPMGHKVTIGELANYELDESLSAIQREDQKRVVKVLGDIEKGQSAITVNADIQAKLADYEAPIGYEIAFGGEQEEVNESFMDLYRSMIVGIVLIGFTLVVMFNSFKQPFIILLTLPLALIGVFPGLMLIGLNLSFPAFLGVVALAGVVVNDAIVLIDKININRKNGVSFIESIAESAKSRLQPIIMTSVTTIVGILPLALSDEFWAGLGFSMVFGLAFSTILTLIVIPVIYYALEVKNALKEGEVL